MHPVGRDAPSRRDPILCCGQEQQAAMEGRPYSPPSMTSKPATAKTEIIEDNIMKNKKHLAISLAILFAVNILVFLLVSTGMQAEAAVYKQGSSGDVVRQIQTRLKEWDYYKGSVDGIYGSKTVAAVKLFQKKNRLTQDGICGRATLAAIGINVSSASSGPVNSSANDIELLARLISAEARGEPYSGQVAVGAVVLNRMKHPSFPSSLSGVIYQNGAFSCMDDGQWNAAVTDSARRAARDAMNGWDTSGGAIYYYNPKTATNKWIRTRPVILSIGRHTFCA